MESLRETTSREIPRRQSRTATLCLGVVLLAGIALRLRQFFAGRSLWYDEAMLAYNLVTRSFAGLLRPLDYHQGAPVGFLFVQKALLLLLGRHDLSLRLFPLLAGITGLCLLWYAGSRTIGRGPALGAVCLAAFCGEMVKYSSEAKQYSSDIVVCLTVFWMACRLLDSASRRREVLLFGIVAGLLLWFSHPAAFVVAGAGVVLLLDAWAKKEGKKAAHLLLAGGVCAASFAALYAVSLRFLASDEYLTGYWRGTYPTAPATLNFFMPMPPWKDFRWFQWAWQRFLGQTAGLRFPWLSSLILLAGAFFLFRRSWQKGAMVVLPCVLVLAASGFEKYPFGGRLLLFLLPFVFLLAGEGVGCLFRLAERLRRRMGAVTATVAVGALVLPQIPPAVEMFRRPEMGEHIKPVMAYVGQKRQLADGVYVYYASVPAFVFYSPRFGFSEGEYERGVAARDNPRRYLEDIDLLASRRRVWFVCTHNCWWCGVDEHTYILQHLAATGTLADVYSSEGAWAYLYVRDESSGR